MDSYNELLQKYNAALKTITDLQAENRQLKERLGISETATTANEEAENTTINKYSSTSEKIALFRKLFCGREDVFARRWYSKATGKSGYQPVCENEWAEGLCDKKEYKCSTCPNRKLLPLTDGYFLMKRYLPLRREKWVVLF